jgi:hypothetical protein
MDVSESVMEEVAELLRSVGVNAAVSDTGGGLLCILIAGSGEPLDEPKFIFGVAADKWAAEVADDERGLWTDVPSGEERPAEIARGILRALSNWVAGRQGVT